MVLYMFQQESIIITLCSDRCKWPSRAQLSSDTLISDGVGQWIAFQSASASRIWTIIQITQDASCALIERHATKASRYYAVRLVSLVWFDFDRRSFGPSYWLFRLAKKGRYHSVWLLETGNSCTSVFPNSHAWEQQEWNKTMR